MESNFSRVRLIGVDVQRDFLTRDALPAPQGGDVVRDRSHRGANR